MLILENWKQTRFAGMPVLKQQMKLYPESTGMEGYADPIPVSAPRCIIDKENFRKAISTIFRRSAREKWLRRMPIYL